MTESEKEGLFLYKLQILEENSALRREMEASKERAERLEGALRKIAKPALGGKQHQWIAQEALKALGK